MPLLNVGIALLGEDHPRRAAHGLSEKRRVGRVGQCDAEKEAPAGAEIPFVRRHVRRVYLQIGPSLAGDLQDVVALFVLELNQIETRPWRATAEARSLQ
jgi:hypothetical protein